MSIDPIPLCIALLLGSASGLAAYEALVRSFAGGSFDLAAVGARARSRKAKPGACDVARRHTAWQMRANSALEAAGRLLERFVPLARVDSDACRERLRRAGLAVAPETWRSVRAISAVGCAALVGLLLVSATPLAPPQLLACAAVAGVIGWALPAADLVRRERKRRDAIEARLPDAMELLGIAMAAGSPIEQCFREVAASIDGPLAAEFALVDQEVNFLGHTREQALEHLADRCRSQDATAFVAQLTQAISQGSSIASGLACQAALAREIAQADALERIRTMPTKLDIVLSLCFLPPTVVLVIVPTIVNLLAFLNDSMV